MATRTNFLDPAATIISKLGGAPKVATITGRDVSRVYRWMASRETGGTGGRVPQEEAEKLLRFASENGVPLEAAEFFAMPSAKASLTARHDEYPGASTDA
jgi:hypothetical protein